MTAHTDNYWLGYLATLTAHTADQLPTPQKKQTLAHLEPFLKSESATPELVRAIQERTQ